ncbi:MAG: YncE family protein, partial [Gammaproteobacteria bacterium]
MRSKLMAFAWLRCAWLALLLLVPGLARAGLALHQVIPLPAVRGAFGGMAADVTHARLFVCVSGENRLLAIDLASGTVIGQLAGLDRPHALVYLPVVDRLAVSNAASGELDFYSADSLAPAGAVTFGTRAAGLGYDPQDQRVYSGYANGRTGGVAVVGPGGEPLNQFVLDDPPAGLVVDRKTQSLFVNLPRLAAVAVFDLASGERRGIWTLVAGRGSPSALALALDAEAGRLFVATRNPDRILVLDTANGRQLQTLAAPGDVGTLAYDPQ